MLKAEKLQESGKYRKDAEVLYKKAFPVNERISFSMMERSDLCDAMVFLSDDKLTGMACMIDNMDITHIIYLAVEESQRNKGYGSSILKYITDGRAGRRIIVDIEKPLANSDNELQRKKRKSFYLRAGFKETSVTYRWQKEDYDILCYGGTITEQEFWEFWDSLDNSKHA